MGGPALGGPLTAGSGGGQLETAGGEVRPAARVVPGSIGLLGGTFDPVHLGHLAIAEEAREALGLETVLFVPAGIPPHKPGRPVTVTHHRVAMVELAIADNPAFRLSRIEVDRPGPSWTVDTVAALAAGEREAGRQPDLTLILSVESYRGLPTWREPARLVEQCRLAVVPREGYQAPGAAWLAEHLPGVAVRVIHLEGPRLRISATEVRARVAAGRSIRYLVPDAVRGYIEDHAIYEDELWRKN